MNRNTMYNFAAASEQYASCVYTYDKTY